MIIKYNARHFNIKHFTIIFLEYKIPHIKLKFPK